MRLADYSDLVRTVAEFALAEPGLTGFGIRTVESPSILYFAVRLDRGDYCCELPISAADWARLPRPVSIDSLLARLRVLADQMAGRVSSAPGGCG